MSNWFAPWPGLVFVLVIRRSFVVLGHQRSVALRKRDLARAGSPDRSPTMWEMHNITEAPTWLVVSCGGGLVVGWFSSPVLAIAVAVVLALATGPVSNVIRSRRSERAFRETLPTFVEELARCLRGGLSPSQALLDASLVTGAPFPHVFASPTALLHSGASAGEAMAAWATTINDSSLQFLSTAVTVGSAVGGIDGQTADAVAVALRERAAVDAVVRVQATQALWSAGVLCGAPIIFCMLVVLSDSRSSAFLLTNPIGIAFGLAGIVLDVFGALWMKSLVRRVSQ
jgi:tight adherence protein B